MHGHGWYTHSTPRLHSTDTTRTLHKRSVGILSMGHCPSSIMQSLDASNMYAQWLVKLTACDRHMPNAPKRFVLGFFLLACFSAHIVNPDTARPVNGPQLIGYSAESTGLAGSGHVAIADTSAINTNPAVERAYLACLPLLKYKSQLGKSTRG